MSYAESKKKLDAIRQEYGCKGDIIFRTAIQNVVEFGMCSLQDKDWYKWTMDDIDSRHDHAEANGKILWCTRDFEKAIVDCSVALSEINTYDFLTYIQREVWLGGDVGEPDYQRAMKIIRNCLYYTDSEYGYYTSDPSVTLRKFREMELDDTEIEYFGWGCLFDVEDEEE